MGQREMGQKEMGQEEMGQEKQETISLQICTTRLARMFAPIGVI